MHVEIKLIRFILLLSAKGEGFLASGGVRVRPMVGRSSNVICKQTLASYNLFFYSLVWCLFGERFFLSLFLVFFFWGGGEEGVEKAEVLDWKHDQSFLHD